MKSTTKHYTKDQIKNALADIKIALVNIKDDQNITELKPVISIGNHKTGKIPVFNLPPVITCLNCNHCKYECYALKPYLFGWKTAVNSQCKNLYLALNNLDYLEKYLIDWITKKKPVFFRIHGSGDFFNKTYLNMWLNVIKACPNTIFLAFTKSFELFTDSFNRPNNFSIVFSEWTNVLSISDSMKNKYHTARCIENVNDIRPNEILCPGNCVDCGLCWSLYKLNINVAFEMH